MCDVCKYKVLWPPRQWISVIALSSEHIKINNLEVLRLGMNIIEDIKCGKLRLLDFPPLGCTPDPHYQKILDWLFVVNLLNFGFANTPKWAFKGKTGYLGICTAVCQAIQQGYDIVNPSFYFNISEALVKTIFCGDNDVEIPMLCERMIALQSAGSALIQHFQGSFVNCVRQADQSALKLVTILTSNFKYFCDKVKFDDDLTVVFHRKAQLLIVNVWVYFKNEGLGFFADIDKLATVTTPIQLQQLFLHLGIFEYSNNLQTLTTSLTSLKSGCREEVDIRGCIIHVQEMLRNLINEHIGGTKCKNPLFVCFILSRKCSEMGIFKNNVCHRMANSIHY